MAKMISIKLQGAKELDRRLANLEKKVGKKITRKAVRVGGKVLLTEAKGNARSMVGGDMGKAIAGNLKLRRQKKRRSDSFGMNVMISEKANDQFVHTTKKGKRKYIPRAIEFGHGEAKPIPFLRRAFETKKEEAVNKAMTSMRDGVQQEAKAKA